MRRLEYNGVFHPHRLRLPGDNGLAPDADATPRALPDPHNSPHDCTTRQSPHNIAALRLKPSVIICAVSSRDRRQANNRQSVSALYRAECPLPPTRPIAFARYWHYFSLPIEEFIASFPDERANLLFSEGISWARIESLLIIHNKSLWRWHSFRQQISTIMPALLPSPPSYFLSLFYSYTISDWELILWRVPQRRQLIYFSVISFPTTKLNST